MIFKATVSHFKRTLVKVESPVQKEKSFIVLTFQSLQCSKILFHYLLTRGLKYFFSYRTQTLLLTNFAIRPDIKSITVLSHLGLRLRERRLQREKYMYLLLFTSLQNTEHAFGMPNYRCSKQQLSVTVEVFLFLFIQILHVNLPKTVLKTQVKDDNTILYIMGYGNISVTNDVTARYNNPVPHD